MDHPSNSDSAEKHIDSSQQNEIGPNETILKLGLLNTQPVIPTEHFPDKSQLSAEEPTESNPAEEKLLIEPSASSELQIRNIHAFLFDLCSSPQFVNTLAVLTEKQYKNFRRYVNNSTILSMLEMAESRNSLKFQAENTPTDQQVENPLTMGLVKISD